jgi:TIR domain
MPKHDVFISYSHGDIDRAWLTGFVERLRRHGVSVWLDTEQIPPGQPWRDAIEDGLRNSDSIVLVLGRETALRPYLFFEIGAAIGMGKRIIPIVAQDVVPSQLPAPIRLRQFLRQQAPEETADEFYTKAMAPTAP